MTLAPIETRSVEYSERSSSNSILGHNVTSVFTIVHTFRSILHPRFFFTYERFNDERVRSPDDENAETRGGIFRVDEEKRFGGGGVVYQSDLEVACLRSRRWMGIRRLPLPQKASKIEAGAIAVLRGGGIVETIIEPGRDRVCSMQFRP